MKKLLICLLLCPSWLWAIDYQADNKPTEHLAVPVSQPVVRPASLGAALASTQNRSTTIEVDERRLLANPELLKRAMQSVLLTKQIEGINVVLPIYRKLPDADVLMISYAQALLAHSQGHLKTAINTYREIIAQDPKLSTVRLDLATALYANQQTTAARDQLLKLQSEELPDSIAQFIQQSIEQIDRETDWQFDANFYYRQDDNINNVPKQRQINFGNGTLKFSKPEQAHGVHLELGAKKRFNLTDRWYSHVQFNIDSDYFWDNHDYDDLSLKTGIGFGYQDVRFAAEIQPFIRKRFYGTEPYSLTTGTSGLFRYQLDPRWRFSTAWEWSYEDFDTRKHLNGQRHFLGFSGLYIRNPQQYWAAGVNYYHSDAKAKEDRFHRIGIFASWEQEWQRGLSSNVTLSLGKRDYEGVDFFNIKRADKEYGAKLSLWHRNIHYWGITPRLTWSWHKTDSNHFYYGKKESIVNVEFFKSF